MNSEVGMALAKSYNISSAGQLSPRKALSPNTIPRPQVNQSVPENKKPWEYFRKVSFYGVHPQ